jgi:hypothetical protein
VFGFHEPFLDHLIEEADKRIEITGNIQDAERLFMDAELRPGEDLGEFVQGTRTAGQCYKSIREIGHQGFPLVH